MKTWFIAIVAVTVGILMGMGSTYARYALHVESHLTNLLADHSADDQFSITPKEDGLLPQAAVDQQDWDFGVVERDAHVQHAFKISNTGDYPLVIESGGTSCAKCTVSDLDKKRVIMPGQATEVVVDYHALVSANFFRQTATIKTNDPARPHITLTVSAKIISSYRLEPAQLVLSHVSATEPFSTELRLFDCRNDNLKVTRCEFLEADSSKYYDAVIQPLPAAQLAKDAKSGISIKLTLKPGLPLGPLQQKIRLTTNLQGNEQLEVPIEGLVEPDFRIFGRGWDDSRQLLELGEVAAQTGAKRDLNCVISGPDREGVEFKVLKCEPEWLKVVVEPAASTVAGRAIRIPIKIEVPPGAPAGIYQDSAQGKPGEIVLETTHPQAKELRMLVDFVVR